QAHHGYCNDTCLRALDARAAATSAPDAVLAQILLDARKSGERSRKRAWDLLREGSWEGAMAPVADNVRGVLLASEGHASRAIAAFESVLESPDAWPEIRFAASFNRYQVAEAAGVSDSQTYFQEARVLDTGDALENIDEHPNTVSEWLRVPGLPNSYFVEANRATSESRQQEAANELWAPWGGDLKTSECILLCGLVLLFSAGLIGLRRFTQPSKACPTCSSVMSKRDAPKQYAAGYCPDCYSLFMQGASLTIDRRRELEERVDNHAKAIKQITIFGNATVGGLGFLLRGNPLRALPLLGLVTLGTALLVAEPPASPFLPGIAEASFDGRATLATLFLLCSYVVSWSMTWRRRKSL
ncbi:MAG: hypothetical protein KC561_20650, partial [Myxococcales bacterium]|nr:hypothetical protein [Myxococcales bacterium]